MGLTDLYKSKCEEISDINYHLPKLKELASQSDHITEMGVRGGVSTIALLMGNPKTLISYDINPIPQFLLTLNHTTNFQFIQSNVLEIEIQPTDLLFIDTYHNYNQLSQELKLHGNKVRKYIAFHDTFSFGYNGESYYGTEEDGILPAIEEFLIKYPEWYIEYNTNENNGFMVIKKGN